MAKAEHGEGDSLDVAAAPLGPFMSAARVGCVSADVQLKRLSPISLAYIGDAVFELYVRSHFLHPPQRIRDYHQQVISHVNAEQQAHYLSQIEPVLTELEQDILRRGRNATTGRNRRSNAKTYQKATGFEALIGYLFLTDQIRLFKLLGQLELVG